METGQWGSCLGYHALGLAFIDGSKRNTRVNASLETLSLGRVEQLDAGTSSSALGPEGKGGSEKRSRPGKGEKGDQGEPEKTGGVDTCNVGHQSLPNRARSWRWH